MFKRQFKGPQLRYRHLIAFAQILLVILLSCKEDDGSTTDLPGPSLTDQHFSILENVMDGTVIGTMEVENGDGKVWEYTILTGNIDSVFIIENTSGRIIVNQSEVIDYETIPRYQLEVQAKNEGIILLSTVKIEIIDVLELPPTLSDQSFKIAENSVEGSLIGIVEIGNSDNNEWSYEILSGNTGEVVRLDPSTGHLTVLNTQLLDFEVIPQLELEIRALDEEYELTGKVTIQLIDEYEFEEAPASGGCKLDRVGSSIVAFGFPKFEGLAPSLGLVNMTVLFVDFNDQPAISTTEEVFDILNPIAADFIDEISYGRMRLKMNPYPEWLRLSESSSFYGNSLTDFFLHRGFIQEAVDLADDIVDFQYTDIVLVVSNPNASQIPYGPTFTSSTEADGIQADGNSITTAITSGHDLNNWGGLWLSHETGHSLTLPDLYQYGSNNPHIHVGDFSLMGDIAAGAPGFFAFERWNLGWLDDNQVYCHESGEIVVELEQLATNGGIKALMVPLSATEALVLESRRRTGFDAGLSKEGVLPYVVNTSIGSGQGTLVVKPGPTSGNRKLDAPMEMGDTYTYQNIQVKVIAQTANSDKVQVIVE